MVYRLVDLFIFTNNKGEGSMQFEILLLGLEPITALTIAVGTFVLAPIVNTVTFKAGSSNSSHSLTESTRKLTKKGLVLGFEAWENTQTTYAQAEKALRDLVADAKHKHVVQKSQEKSESNAILLDELESRCALIINTEEKSIIYYSNISTLACKSCLSEAWQI